MLYVTSGKQTHSYPIHAGATLAQNLFAAGLYQGRPLCAGLGACGRCRVLYLSDPPAPDDVEVNVLSTRQLTAGWRLSCRHLPVPGTSIRIAHDSLTTPASGDDVSLYTESWDRLAIDIGTTAIKWQGVQPGSSTLHYGHLLNPQVGAGADVMARMAFAQLGPAMSLCLQQCLITSIERLVGRKDISRPAVVVTGNSVMIYSLLGRSFQGLAASPYALTYAGGAMATLTRQHASSSLQVYIPPLLAPFVGADIACGLAHILGHYPVSELFPFILADFGTNGEFVLALGPDNYWVTSVAMGPALEGIGLTRGKIASSGVCTGFTLTRDGLCPAGGSIGHGISGTGYLSLVSLLRRTGVLDDTGLFTRPGHLVGQRIENMVQHNASGKALVLEGKTILTGRDVEEILKLKASCNYALKSLLGHGRLRTNAVRKVFVSGALGGNLRPLELVDLGFFPTSWEKKICLAGNTALKGAWDLLVDKDARTRVQGLQGHVQSLDLPAQDDFARGYVAKMRFGYC
ncbi:ASKHA domain-containing protein [Desulfoplanes formicivorans]|uniref:Ferredoxin n=1 Tax=Desulfoplanes formicivorans TaxID=1592317 RepID=A0A194ADV5_9BACT|nr:ASKHA domain-containing protein [Desulfoplanes formicivorans]GAU07518.1 ferredoxin [Desulfoplanes formicivorans]